MSFGAQILRRCWVAVKREWESYWQAAVEVGVICISAFLPLWAGIGFYWLTMRVGAAAGYGDAFMKSGEMLVIACAIIGPLLYVITRKYGKLPGPLTVRFPFGVLFALFTVLLWFIAGAVFVAKKGGDLFDDDVMWKLSMGISCVSVAVLYLATALRNSMEKFDVTEYIHEAEEKFLRDFGSG